MNSIPIPTCAWHSRVIFVTLPAIFKHLR
uniref:Uncharacterized protein n=1 Tax=Rhizophora mucronata TaxID=61149 RepID=A0A2P2N018_RHIMU